MSLLYNNYQRHACTNGNMYYSMEFTTSTMSLTLTHYRDAVRRHYATVITGSVCLIDVLIN